MLNKVESVLIEETRQSKPIATNEDDRCIFYKDKKCHPAKMEFKICIKCHKCSALTPATAIPAMFNFIVGLAGLLMATFGMGQGTGSGGGGGAAAGGGK